MTGWLPLSSFFQREPECPISWLLVDGVELHGYWDDDAGCWYREGEGADLESEPVQPTHWQPCPEACEPPLSA